MPVKEAEPIFSARIIFYRGCYYYSLYVKPTFEQKKGMPLACHVLCNFKLKRPHLTCLWCRPRRVYYKKMKSKIPVDLIVLQIPKQQKHGFVKAKIRKFLLTLVGYTMN